MLARVKTTTNIYNTLQYNERKLMQGHAECLLGENFIKDLDQLSSEDKINRFLQRTSLNERAEHNSLHVSLNFGYAEAISNEKMQTIAKHYMQGMGLDAQPYLAYRHFDSGHEHLHIVSTNIRADGSQIDIDPDLLRHSRELTKTMEKQFALVPNQKTSPDQEEQFKVRQAQRVKPGQGGLQRSISNVLNTVVDHYKYTNLDELNAVLRLYNVNANRGSEDSTLYKNHGLLYHAVDDKNHKVGKAIKASDFAVKPTLSNLEKKFTQNESLRNDHTQRLKTSIDWTLAGQPPDWPGFLNALEQEGINVVIREDSSRRQPGVFFVDHKTQSVFTGEDLGTTYTLQSLRERCAPEQNLEQDESLRQRLRREL